MARLKRQKFLSILKERETEREGGAGREGERGRGRKGGREGEGGREKERERGGGGRGRKSFFNQPLRQHGKKWWIFVSNSSALPF